MEGGDSTLAPSRKGDGALVGPSSGGVVLSDAQLGNMALRAKQHRTKAEQDKQLLQNRINRLIIEQERAMKRIEETKRRTQEIQQLKQRNSANQAARADAGAWLDSEQQVQRELLQENRIQRSTAISEARSAMYSLKKDEVSVLRQMSRENEMAVREHKDLELGRAVARKQTVREHERQAKDRRAIEESAARERATQERASKKKALDEDSYAHVNAYRSLADEEQKLLASLAKWNSVQDEAYTQLDDVLASSKAFSRPDSRSTARSAPLATTGEGPLEASPRAEEA